MSRSNSRACATSLCRKVSTLPRDSCAPAYRQACASSSMRMRPSVPISTGNDAGIGEIAGAEHDRRLGVLDAGEALFELGIERVVAGDEPRGAGAGAVFRQRRGRRGFDRRMLGEIEVVVAGERQQPPAVALDPDAVFAQGLGQRPAQVAPRRGRRALLAQRRRASASGVPVRPSGRKEAPNGGEYQRKSRAAGLVCGRAAACLAALYADEDRARAPAGRRAPKARASCSPTAAS